MKLIENGLHSFKKAIQNLKQLDKEQNKTERELMIKDIVIGLHHSIETLFKYMIHNKNEILLYGDIEGYFSEQLDMIINKNPRDYIGQTITFKEAVKRTVVLNNIQLDKTEFGSFERLNTVRNAITHHEYDLTDKKIIYLITQVITVIFPIYTKLIPKFDQYVIVNDLNLIGSVQVKEFHVWRFIQFFKLNTKFIKGKEKLGAILSKTDEFKKRSDRIKKEAYITYHECPCCDKSFFIKENIIWDKSEERGYTGHCLMCEITLDKEDAYLLYLSSANYKSIYSNSGVGFSIVRELLGDSDLEDKLNAEEIKKIEDILQQPENVSLLTDYTNEYLMLELEFMLEPYAHEIADNYDSALLDSAIYTMYIKRSHKVHELSEDDFGTLEGIIENLEALQLSKEYYIKALNQEFIFYLGRTHRDPHNDEDIDINIDATLTLTDRSFITSEMY
ncbi:hypothetical protein SAMN05421503_1407 [Terribacillus aidingensis]|uniref:Uncharacterized protein n=1 Tax=Terribacillus aidingensis TaxID=586416 RepID=A0A285NLR7_9BACI|nr:hypothetical protein [Terribacillus aidingensis]SNZ09897.1 hypothetical protein SAMN05421503_1407 [Terribacillus aidingensis]